MFIQLTIEGGRPLALNPRDIAWFRPIPEEERETYVEPDEQMAETMVCLRGSELEFCCRETFDEVLELAESAGQDAEGGLR